MELLQDNPRIEDYRQIILSLKDQPIVNFTGLTNTELKLQYGAPNITLLTTYDQNYTLLVRTLQQWAQALYDGGFSKEACQLLEFRHIHRHGRERDLPSALPDLSGKRHPEKSVRSTRWPNP